MYLSGLTDKPIEKDVEITGITADSRNIQPGMIFAAFPGSKVDGRDFISAAIKNGAAAILTTDAPLENLPDIPVIHDPCPRRRYARIAALLHPHHPEIIVAVTGSNGKSSTVNFCRQIWEHLDQAAASMGTIGIEGAGMTRNANMTTPDPVTLHTELEKLAANGINHLAIEASSHGLDQYRIDGLKLAAAGFTNISRDHLDYHGDMEQYFKAKSRLFSEVLPPGHTAVLNADSPHFRLLKDICDTRGCPVIDYGYAAEILKIRHRDIHPKGQTLHLTIHGENVTATLPLVGEFQAYNALCALGMVMGSANDKQLPPDKAATALQHLSGVRGRMEQIGIHPNGAAVFVDYAHTPDGLQTVLKSLRPHTQNKLAVVFGCGGDRDAGKRPMMGEIAERLADRIYITDDNPRTEVAAAIRAEIMTACPRGHEMKNRRNAIETAIADLQNGDILVIAGKGHERGQIIGTETHPFDDAEIARDILNSAGAAPS